MKKINLAFSDNKEIFYNVPKNKRYSILLEVGESKYYFTNKDHVKRFLAKYQKYINSIFNLLAENIANVNALYLQSIRFINDVDSMRLNEKLNDCVLMLLQCYKRNTSNTYIISTIFKILNNCAFVLSELRLDLFNAKNFIPLVYACENQLLMLENLKNSFSNQYKDYDSANKNIPSSVKVFTIYKPSPNIKINENIQ